MTQSVTLRARLAAGFLAAAFALLAPTPGAAARGAGFEERVAGRKAVEEVYWRHRIWPETNAGAKPALSAVLPDSVIRARVGDDLRKSNALEVFWRRSVRPSDLQAELDRMVANTRDPRMLGELFAALGNDPTLIAETLARPALVDRLIRSWYASDARLHAALRKKAEAALRSCRSLACMPSMGGLYRETTFRLGGEVGGLRDQEKPGDAVRLDADRWQRLLSRLGRRAGGDALSLRLLEPGGLEETADGFVVTTVLSQRKDEVRTASVTWPKTTFDAWWFSVRDSVAEEVDSGGVAFTLAALDAPGCTDDTWRTLAPRLPDPRIDHTAVWTGSEMIVWGGEGGVLLNTGGRYQPATDTWTPTSTGDGLPAPRRLHTAVWSGAEMIVWGGVGPAALGTGGRYDPQADTWTPTPTNGAPAARSGHTAVWTGFEMVVWGGSGNVYLNTGARYNPSLDAWFATPTAANVPAPRSGHTAVWTGTSMIVWGGVNTTTGYQNTGGVYDPSLDTWATTSTGTNVASARADHTAVWSGSEMIVWGGSVAGVVILNTGRRYNPATNTWALVSAGTNAPSARFNHSAVWTGTEMIVWGGDGGIPLLNNGARYLPAADTWTPLAMGGAVPSARSGHTAVWTGTEMIVWGGDDGISVVDTGGRFDPMEESWVPTATGKGIASARSSHTAVWTGSEMIVWGGFNDVTNQVSTGSRYDPATDAWIETSTSAGVPAARSDHAAVWTGTEMIVWGGYSPGSGYVATGGRYNPAANAWAPTSTGMDLPAGRGGTTAVWTGAAMLVWGGYDANVYMNSGGLYDPGADMWTPTSVLVGVPSPRYAHSAVWTGTEMIVWGGYDGSALDTGGRYDPAGNLWQGTSFASPAPTPRSGHTAVWTGGEMIVWGGFPSLNSGGRYRPDLDAWSATSIGDGVPSGRSAHAAVWTGSEMLVWGGFDGAYLNTGGRYDPSADAWTPTSTGAGVPVARFAHAPVWTGREMIVWGDSNGIHLRTGGSYCACPAGGLYYRDEDGDGYGVTSMSWPTCDGLVPAGYSLSAGDCDDANPSRHPAAEEICNGVDDNCNATLDDVALSLSPSGQGALIAWTTVSGSSGYDVVRGNLTILRDTGGDFTAAIEVCLADDAASSPLEDAGTLRPGEAVFYLVRADGCSGSWNSGGPAQQGDRDPEIAASPAACP
jgi:hypothetical protein